MLFLASCRRRDDDDYVDGDGTSAPPRALFCTGDESACTHVRIHSKRSVCAEVCACVGRDEGGEER